jgi:peptidoglycan/LPS O-acetylase OafA/YrhL
VVVLFHVYLVNGHRLGAEHPVVDAVVGPLASQGDLGVDLFFLLSGAARAGALPRTRRGTGTR